MNTIQTLAVVLISSTFAVGIFVFGFLIGRGKTQPPLEYLPEDDEDMFRKEQARVKNRIEEVKAELDYHAPDDNREANIERANDGI